jgi:hypothetical protein
MVRRLASGESVLSPVAKVFDLTQGAGQKLEFALNRTGCGAKEVEWLSTGDNLQMVRRLASGESILSPVAKVVDKLLEDIGSVTIDMDPVVDPSEALMTAAATPEVEALRVDENFIDILVQAKVSFPTLVTMKRHRVKKNVSDPNIESHLPKEHEIDPTAFVWMLAIELMKVRSGKQSNVLAKDWHCLFCVAGFVVSVWWNSGGSEWSVSVWRHFGLAWNAENIIFTCN